MNRVFLIGQRPLKEKEIYPKSRLTFFSNKENPKTKKPTYYSIAVNEIVTEPVNSTKLWLKTAGFDSFLLELIYDDSGDS